VTPRPLVFVTNNIHKLEEIKDIFSGYHSHYLKATDYHLLSLGDIGCHDEIEETSDTIEGNALLKARTIYQKYEVNCFADDTGLEVEALNGRPGVHSARYAGEEKKFDRNIEKLLSELEPESNRKARFRTIIALILDGKEILFEGIVEGSILDQRRGTGGFGYDPVFVPDGFDLTFAEMTPAQKNQISHRFKAIQKLMEHLLSPLPSLKSPPLPQ
jgi:XTP/dITP diphosphohydrolase